MNSYKSIQKSLRDTDATNAFGKLFAKAMQPGVIIYLRGNLGVGKTTLVRAILNALSYTDVVKSPTYTLIECYPLQDFTLNHLDLYRLKDPEELEYLGIRDYIMPDTVSIFEWPEKGGAHIPKADIEINLEFEGEGRLAVLTANTSLGNHILDAIKAANQ